jgi:predicted GNAT family N-acyltransferase
MNDKGFQVRFAEWGNHQDQNLLRQIRNQVFVEEQAIPASAEWDGLDESARHLLLLKDRNTIGCARLIEQDNALKIGRVAILGEHRGLGAGRFLMNAIKQEAVEDSIERLYLEAQTQAFNFYSACGYVATSTPFNDCDIPHIKMELSLTAEKTTSGLFVSSVDEQRYPMEDAIEQQGYLELQLQQCHRQILIQWESIQAPLLALPALQNTLLRLIKHNPKTKIQILVAKLESQETSPLMTLIQRLNSRIKLKLIHDDHPVDNLVLCDTSGFYKIADKNGWTCFNDRGRVKQHIDDFETRWQHSQVPHQQRRLYL